MGPQLIKGGMGPNNGWIMLAPPLLRAGATV